MALPFKSIFSAYARLVVFAIGLLLGIQVPSFIDQYQKRVDAHFQEVSINISGFQRTADLMFDGDLRELVAYYAASSDPVFVRDANSVRLIVDRFERLSKEQAELSSGIVSVAIHVIFAADQEFFDEAIQQYSYTVPLNSIAIQWGLALAVLLTLLIDCGVIGCVACGRLVKRKIANQAFKKRLEP